MAKTTKQTRGIHSWIKFQKHQGVESLTIQGKDALADLSQDKNGDTNLILNADKDKVNAVASSVPYLGISHTTTGTAPNQEKTATISQDLTQFPLSGGELVTVTKETDSLTIHDEKVKEFVTNAISEVLSKVPITVAYYGGLINQFDRQETNISFQNDEGFNHYLMVTVIDKNNVVSQFKFAREDFVDADKPYKIVNDFVISVKAELTDDKYLVLIFNTHGPMDTFEYQIMYEWFTNYESTSIDTAYQEKRIRIKHSEQSEYFEGYKNPLNYEPNVPLTYIPNTPSETPSNPPELPNVTFPTASTSPTPETAGNIPQPLPEESH
jgi:hypothetical protein|nr:MAG TPA: hypothetical protein [Caudoviricetes sp.]